jgi:hypothetical protein
MRGIFTIALTLIILQASAQNSIGWYGSPYASFRTTKSTADFKTSEKMALGNEWGLLSNVQVNEHIHIVSQFAWSNYSYANSSYFSSDNLAKFKLQTFSFDLGSRYYFSRETFAPYMGLSMGYHHVFSAKYSNSASSEHLVNNSTTHFFSATIFAGAEYFLSETLSVHAQALFNHSFTTFTVNNFGLAYSEYPFRYGLQLGINVYLP